MTPGGRRVDDHPMPMDVAGIIIDRMLAWAAWMHDGAPLRRYTDRQPVAPVDVVQGGGEP